MWSGWNETVSQLRRPRYHEAELRGASWSSTQEEAGEADSGCWVAGAVRRRHGGRSLIRFATRPRRNNHAGEHGQISTRQSRTHIMLIIPSCSTAPTLTHDSQSTHIRLLLKRGDLLTELGREPDGMLMLMLESVLKLGLHVWQINGWRGELRSVSAQHTDGA